ncbi:MAG: hypothetical protein H0T78_00710, partial [Longispora sp.]|nr:hypothetical protein [Longispora sp. (in: high G+C Gram-positive bacteria)]
AQGFSRGLYGLLAIAMLLFARSLGSGTEFLGLVFVTGAIGALLAAAITPAATRRWGGQRWLLILLILNAVTVGVLTPAFQPVALLAAVFMLNVASMGIKIVVDTALQHECADEYRGRVFSVNDTAFNTLYVVGLFVGAYALPVNGRSASTVMAVTACYLLLGAWYFGRTRAYGASLTRSRTER